MSQKRQLDASPSTKSIKCKKVNVGAEVLSNSVLDARQTDAALALPHGLPAVSTPDHEHLRGHAENIFGEQVRNEDYTVGWVCALNCESVAACLILDEKRGPPEYRAENDTNAYTLGRVGKHNVAITVFPAGDYGTACAAAVVSHMVHSFPNVRIGLMVGIGGGAPTVDHDIRLGDIVVSWPGDGLGGVFQYDFGKTLQNQTFQHTRFLDQPPPLLRSAAQDLRAQHAIDGHQLDEAIQEVLRKKPKIKRHYQRPEPSRLYRSEVIHSKSQANCESCGEDLSRLVMRNARTEDDDIPSVHYGLIASANQVMKDAKARTSLRRRREFCVSRWKQLD
ncbi:hypothetical protein LTR10_021041 [Elasticomyces elasticus]|nr:hypothetical protein LTR10_021041 [Elasticomyces elasticus]KAK5027761.1 hypothetical protein LTS07_006636 [Exophiala sideris]